MNESTFSAPERSVRPQSPSPTIVSYSVMRGSSFMSALQPAVMRALSAKFSNREKGLGDEVV